MAVARALRAVGKDAGKLGLAEIPARTPLRKQIGWHISQGTVHAALFQVHPDDAKELLERNSGENYRNRAPAARTVSKYAEEMKQGWRLTGEPLIVSQSGRLLNGQHRLLACIEAGVSFQTMITFGIADDAFSFLDLGKKRTAADVFSIHGVAEYHRTAAAVMWVWKYFKTGMSSPGGNHRTHLPGPSALWDFYQRHRDIENSDPIAWQFQKNKLAPPSLVQALHYLCAQRNREQADRFFMGIATGENLKKSDPALRVRNRLIEERIGGGRLADVFVGAFIVLAWNAMREGRAIKVLRWRTEAAPDLAFPTIV